MMHVIILYTQYAECYIVMYMFCLLTLASSVINVTQGEASLSDNNDDLYNIAITCIIHPDSTANHCVVMAVVDGRVNGTGIYVCVCNI